MISEKSETVWKRRPGLVGLYCLIPTVTTFLDFGLPRSPAGNGNQRDTFAPFLWSFRSRASPHTGTSPTVVARRLPTGADGGSTLRRRLATRPGVSIAGHTDAKKHYRGGGQPPQELFRQAANRHISRTLASGRGRTSRSQVWPPRDATPQTESRGLAPLRCEPRAESRGLVPARPGLRAESRGLVSPSAFFAPRSANWGDLVPRFLPRSAIWSPTPEESPGHESRVSASRVPNLRSRHKAGIKPRMLAEKDTKLLDIVAPFPLGGTKRGVFAKATSTNSTAESRSADSSTENYKRARQHETLRQRKKERRSPRGHFASRLRALRH